MTPDPPMTPWLFSPPWMLAGPESHTPPGRGDTAAREGRQWAMAPDDRAEVKIVSPWHPPRGAGTLRFPDADS
jgi:hypothetical protein